MNADIKHCCSDLKVLGRKEFRTLLRWRLSVREMFGLDSKENAVEIEVGEVAEVESMDEDLKAEEELQRVSEKNMAKKRRMRRKANDGRKKEIMRLQMGLQGPSDVGLRQQAIEEDDSMFSFATISLAMDTPTEVDYKKSLEHAEVQDFTSPE